MLNPGGRAETRRRAAWHFHKGIVLGITTYNMYNIDRYKKEMSRVEININI